MFFTPNGAIRLVERMRSSDTPDFDHFVGAAIFSKWRSAAIQRQFSFSGFDLQSELRVFSGGEQAHDGDLLEALSRWSVTSQHTLARFLYHATATRGLIVVKISE
jgi:hypothetical protein